jgi:hypothetical protein
MDLSHVTHWVIPGTPHRRKRCVALVLSALGIVLACNRDTPTGPRTDPERAPAAPQFNVDPGPSLPPPEGSQVPHGLTVTIGTHQGDGSIAWQKLGEMPRWVVGQMKIRQRATQFGVDRGSLVAGPQGIYVAGFLDNRCVLKAGMGFRDQGGIGGWTEDWWAGGANCPSQAEEDQNPHLTWLRAGWSLWGGRSSGSAELCGRGCHTYGGSTTFIFTPTSNVLKVVATVLRVLVGGKVTFTAARDDGRAVPAVERWVWKPRSGTGRTVACHHTEPSCTTEIYEDGWMFAHVVIDNFLHTGNAGVTVEHKFELKADKAEAEVGETVTFEPYLDDEKTAAVLWRWVPQAAQGEDPSSVTPVEVKDCAGKDTCPWVLQGSGTMWAYRSNPPSGKSDEEASRAVTALSKPALQVVFTPEQVGLLNPYQKHYVSPKIVNGKPLCTIGEIRSRREIIAQVKDASGQALPDKTITLTLQAQARSGGHDHGSKGNSEADRPLGHFALDPEGKLPITTVTTESSGDVLFYYIPPEFSGEVTITGKSPGAADGTHTLTVGVRDLQPIITEEWFRPVDVGGWSEVWSVSGTFALYDRRKYRDHGFPHNGKADFIVGLLDMAKEFNAKYSSHPYDKVANLQRALYFNDFSLALGGRFDAEADWGPEEHCSHRWGDAGDMRKSGLTEDQLNWIRAWWHKYTGYIPPKSKNERKRDSVGIEGDHWHLRLLP